ncbi:TIGR03086 family metal-binding protein [Actinocorallia sp. B10E7]|uniref:TIGR03086 family metal-binding protein n=1 Tax=Actinocorallia sp. B10E7 TaxID=3153558 RepID=UPI00325E76D0
MTREPSGYERALDLFEGVVVGVPENAWSLPSPCEGWTAGDLLGHVIGGQLEIIALVGREEPPDAADAPGRLVGPDPVASWRRARAACAAALTPEALATPIPFGGFGELPLRDLLDTYVLELLVHAWDLARAAGLPVRLDPDLVHRASATAQVIGTTMRKEGLLGPALTPPRGAGELTRLLAFLGRDEGSFPERASG